MGLESTNLIALKEQFLQKKYEYNDLNDGTGVVVSIETGKIITLNELGNLVISGLVNESDNAELTSTIERIATEVSQKHGVPDETVLADVTIFIDNLTKAINQHS